MDDDYFLLFTVAKDHQTQDVRPFENVGKIVFPSGNLKKCDAKGHLSGRAARTARVASHLKSRENC